jgi:probable F420-dependent oxidoreductase
MRVGLALPVAPELNEPGVIGSLVRAAEGLGFSSLWVSDHLLLPPGDFIPHGHQPDPLAMLGWLAAATERVGIGTSVLVLPYRDPVVVAKAAGTADWLSGGRVTLGVGVGWLPAEFTALGIPFAERGARTDAALRTLRALPAEPDGMRARPAAAPGRAIPLLVGGNTPRAVRRAATLGDGWQPLNLTPEGLAAGVERYRAACERAGRASGRVSARVSPRRFRGDGVPFAGDAAAVRADLEAYGAAGADDVVVSFEEDGGPAEVLRRWAGFAARAGLA